MLPDFNRLHVFYHVYRQNSFKLAAQTLFLTQPGVSQHIRKLEEEIHTPLFVRQHKKIIPTRAGKRLFQMIKPYIETISDHLPYIAMPMEQPFGRLRIGAPLEFGKSYLPEICAQFRKIWPRVTFKIKFEEPDLLLTMVEKNDVDMAIVDFFSAKDQVTGRPERFRIHPLTEEFFVLACSKDYHDRNIKGDVSFDTLSRQAYLTDEHEPFILRHWFRHYFKKTPKQLDIVMAIESHPALIKCMELGMGLTITAHHIIEKDVNAGKIITVFPPGDRLLNRVSLVQLKGKTLTMTEKTFEDYMIGYFMK